jgi:hypothetical protein
VSTSQVVLQELTVDTTNLTFPIGDWSMYRWLWGDGFWTYVGRWRRTQSWVERWRTAVPLIGGGKCDVFIEHVEADNGAEVWWCRIAFQAADVLPSYAVLGTLPVAYLHIAEILLVQALMRHVVAPRCWHTEHPLSANGECVDPGCFMREVRRNRVDLDIHFRDVEDVEFPKALLVHTPQPKSNRRRKGSYQRGATAGRGRKGVGVKVYMPRDRHPGLPPNVMRIETQHRKAPIAVAGLRQAGEPVDLESASELWREGFEWSGLAGAYGGARLRGRSLADLHGRTRQTLQDYLKFLEAGAEDPAWPVGRQRRAHAAWRRLGAVPGLPDLGYTGQRRRLNPETGREEPLNRRGRRVVVIHPDGSTSPRRGYEPKRDCHRVVRSDEAQVGQDCA